MKNLLSQLSEEQLNELLTYTPDFSDTNLENIKRLSLEKVNASKKPARRRFPMKKITALIAAAVFLLATTTIIFAATVSGELEQFLSRFNPNFGEFAIAPLYPAYAENQGIRIEAVGAQQIGAVVLVYVTVQDISGENRITRHISPDLELYINGQIMNVSKSSRRLNFDRSTNTAYFEMRLVGEAGMPRADTIKLVTSRIQCFQHSGPIRTVVEGAWSITVNTSDLGIQPITWVDVVAGGLYIEYMSLTPFGLQLVGTHSYGMGGLQLDGPYSHVGAGFPTLDVSLELENRRRDVSIAGGSSGGVGDDSFIFHVSSNSPIDIDAVVAVIVNGVRVLVP